MGDLFNGLQKKKQIQFFSKKQSIKPKIKFNKQIQSHKGAINIIKINRKIDIIITAGNDNYVYIRKIYDL